MGRYSNGKTVTGTHYYRATAHMAVIKREITFSFSPNPIQHLSNTAMTSLQHYCQHKDVFQRLAINVGLLNGNDSRAGRCVRSLEKMVDDVKGVALLHLE